MGNGVTEMGKGWIGKDGTRMRWRTEQQGEWDTVNKAQQ